MSRTIFVGNVSYQASEEALRELFEVAGSVTSVSIPKDRETGRPRGFAFVEFADSSSAATAIDTLDGSHLDGRSVRVSLSNARADRPTRNETAAPRWVDEPEDPRPRESHERGKPRGGWREDRHRASRRHSRGDRDD